MLTLIVRSRSGSRASWIYFEHRAVGVFLREFEVGDPLGLALDRDDRGRRASLCSSWLRTIRQFPANNPFTQNSAHAPLGLALAVRCGDAERGVMFHGATSETCQGTC